MPNSQSSLNLSIDYTAQPRSAKVVNYNRNDAMILANGISLTVVVSHKAHIFVIDVDCP